MDVISEYLRSITEMIDAQSLAIDAMAGQLEDQDKRLQTMEKQLSYLMNLPEIMVHQVPAIDRDRIDYEIDRMNDLDCKDVLNHDPRPSNLTISLTSFPARMHELKYTLYSLVRQTIKPDRIILWLTHEEFPRHEEEIAPYLLELIKRWKITIGWTHNERAYNKLIPSLKAYPDDIIVTADDDIFYWQDWLEGLYRDYLQYGNITAHRVDRVIVDGNGRIKEHASWPFAERGSVAYANVGTGVGGVLYFPGCFHPDVTDATKYMRLCPMADDLWFWAMEVLGGQKIRTTRDPVHDMICVNPMREFSKDPAEHLMAENVFRGGNERQLRSLLEEYPQLERILKEEDKALKDKEMINE